MTSFFGAPVMKIKQTQIHKTKVKPVECDAHLKYICPECNNEHWISLLEASTKNFKIVCDCGTIFRVKRVLDLKLRYQKAKPAPTTKKTNIDIKTNSIAKQAVTIIQNYGFTKDEAEDLIVKCYDPNKNYSVSDLVKEALKTMRVNNESLDETV